MRTVAACFPGPPDPIAPVAAALGGGSPGAAQHDLALPAGATRSPGPAAADLHRPAGPALLQPCRDPRPAARSARRGLPAA